MMMMEEQVDDEHFFESSRSITRQFVALYLDQDSDILARSPEERDRALKFKKQIPNDEIAREVAEKIRQVGDQLDSRLKGKIKEAMEDLFMEQSVWEVGYTQFSATCSGILSSCHGYVRNGWEQVSVVYITAGQLISELRYQQDDAGLRQTQMEGYTGTYLSDTGLQEWTMERGGFSNVTDLSEKTSVPIDDD